MEAFRLLQDGFHDGAWNMAVDESILARCEEDDSAAPTLRLYSWTPAALSLGRGQAASASADVEFLAREGIDLVRRPTGGTAVLHDRERTYSVVARLRRTPFDGGVVDTYRKISAALAAALAELGLDAKATPAAGRARGPRSAATLCFAERSQQEIAVAGRKVVGRAQLRRRGAFLQHGSILLSADAVRAARATGSAPSAEAPFAGVEDFLRRPVDPATLDRAVVAAFARVFGVKVVPGDLTAAENSRAEALRAEKYRSAAWTLDGRTPTPEAARYR